MFNRYCIGYAEKRKHDAADIVRLAYQTAAFTNTPKRPKPMQYYLDKIFKPTSRGSKESALEQIRLAKEMDRKIEEQRRMEAMKDAG